jgi:hypothetical protein
MQWEASAEREVGKMRDCPICGSSARSIFGEMGIDVIDCAECGRYSISVSLAALLEARRHTKQMLKGLSKALRWASDHGQSLTLCDEQDAMMAVAAFQISQISRPKPTEWNSTRSLQMLDAHCGKAGLAFVRQRGNVGDLYRCTAQIPCGSFTTHYRRYGKACGIAAEARFYRARLNWIACPDQPEVANREWGHERVA